MPDDVQLKIDICKKHEAVLLMNVKTFVMQAKHVMKMKSEPEDLALAA